MANVAQKKTTQQLKGNRARNLNLKKKNYSITEQVGRKLREVIYFMGHVHAKNGITKWRYYFQC